MRAQQSWRQRLDPAIVKDVLDSVHRQVALKANETRRLWADFGPPLGTPVIDEIRALGGFNEEKVERFGHGGELTEARALGLIRRTGGLSVDRMAESLAACGLLRENSHAELFEVIEIEARRRGEY